ncbi:unnamed protein product [Notodromas monacha]|uniref:Uncharacterized protein n=1 Tax=Notodromas monacha TaxID=399045 RepID=A0A7R9BKX4_9CRUS|nr:unnamed protein product [Notodromas monacha]CAG0916061.1 unnamed protein product [Notodromas monacha]
MSAGSSTYAAKVFLSSLVKIELHLTRALQDGVFDICQDIRNFWLPVRKANYSGTKQLRYLALHRARQAMEPTCKPSPN